MRWIFLLLPVLALCVVGCQGMDYGDDLSVIPATNNPLLIQDPNRSPYPGSSI